MTQVQENLNQLRQALNQQIVGQEELILKMLIALLADGHLLVEGAPGLAKTTAIKALSAGIDGDFHRIQFTPDLLPADLTGSDVYRPEDGSFHFQHGPLFHNLVLADEINRAPAKVQAALLEAMAERQITVGQQSYVLPPLYLVMATQNPIEQEGTYPLPEAQLDRFLMFVKVGYPDAEAEQQILHIARKQARNVATDAPATTNKISQADLFAAREALFDIYMAPEVERYIVELVTATRSAGRYSEQLAQWIEFGASPRATIALDRCARAHAFLHEQEYVSPDNIHAIAYDVLRHRILLSYAAEAENLNSDEIIRRLLTLVPSP
jgi:MoxR-like ATPase